jgi:hypothetical protein
LKSLAQRQIYLLRQRARGYGLKNLRSANIVLNDTSTAPRLNILIGAISRARLFGGTATALRLFESLGPCFGRMRVLSLNEDDQDFEPDAWPGWKLETSDPLASRTVRFLGGDAQLNVEPGDRFIATFWPTAHYLQDLVSKLRECGRTPGPYVYLIQDFEPGFYPWSSDYVLADATYADSADFIPIFNTQLLADFFTKNGYAFEKSYAFEPSLNPVLQGFRSQARDYAKEKVLLVYGRPGSERNAFDIVVETMRVWSRIYPRAGEWRIVSMGHQHRPISLERGLVMRSRGKTSLEAYAHQLLEASVGLSLMISPHPSYPPMEMAEFGLRVVTNDFANKRLSERSPNIRGLASATPQALAEALARCCDEHDMPTSPRDFGPVFIGGADEFPFAKEVARELLSERGNP